jgi:DNA repair protein SbcC/Rad50
MHIAKVELENFKSHANSTFEFGRGTTSITGENGAGKTSIIEAIAWTIFDTLDYKKEDLVRRGAKKGTARVTFESGLDEREYTIYRDTGNGYYVYDPHVRARIADKKEEVTRFLWQHLGIEPGTDLESLFRHAIGVPQGTFTAIFLATATERKRTFDGLLKVEEYRRSSDELLRTVRFLDQQMAAVNVKIARAEGEIARIEVVERERETTAAQIAELTERVTELAAGAAELHQTVSRLDEIESRLGGLLAEAERLRGELARAELVLKHCESDLERSREAAERVADVKADAEAYLSTLGRLKELERERGERQKLRDVLASNEAALNSVKTERKHLLQDTEKFQKAHAQIKSLRSQVPDQEKLENKLGAKRLEFAKAEGAAGQLAKIDERLKGLRDSYRDVSDQLNAAREKGLEAARLEGLQSRDAEIVRELANVTAALERDERFQQEIKNGLCPILSAKCLNLGEGQTLEAFISSQFGELRMQIDVLKKEQLEVGDALKAAREAERFGARVSILETRVKEIGEEGKELKKQKAEIEREAGKLDRVRKELKRIEDDLKALENPKAKISILEKVVSREIEVRVQLSESEKNLERLESDRRITVEKLESYKDLDAFFEEANSIRERTAAAYRVFIANETAAAQAVENETAYHAARQAHKAAAEAASAADEIAKKAAEDYDRDLHLAQRAALVDLQRRQAEASVMLGSARRRLTELAAEAERLYDVRRSMQTEFHERERLQRISETTDFIRSTLKDAAPLVARNYVHHVSLEAGRMFREIHGDAECTLKWTEDYGIALEQGGYDRPFQSLSGGEQMSAALAVRLALLKQLSDIHIAFFDEPTANMDAERRENLAMQIGNIGHFEQLFVISHDDTFEGYMDHEVKVESSQHVQAL